ncbi:transposase [Streptomyces sp. WAC 01325]|uniref:transposase n=1 Tax=Streptomyces sp. WAC 01325 TaxID=2203202 RepID=UPI0028B02408|nr:transposase [Streptomyces sp. WAC 01325]
MYLRGLLLDGRLKSVEPVAARLGEDGNRQALAHFITTSPWGRRRMCGLASRGGCSRWSRRPL